MRSITITKLRFAQLGACLALAGLSAMAAAQTPPPMNPYLAQTFSNQAHWNSAQTDSTEIAVPRGSYELTPESLTYLPSDAGGMPHFVDKVGDTMVTWWWSGLGLRKYNQIDGKLVEVARTEMPLKLPDFQKVDDKQRLKQTQDVKRLLDNKDEQGLLDYMRGQPNRVISSINDQLRGGALYSMLTREDAFIGAGGRQIFRVDQVDPKKPDSAMGTPLVRVLPETLYDNEKVKRGTDFTVDFNFGMGMTFNGYLVLNTVGGKVITLNPKNLEIVDTYAVDGADELFLNGFANGDEAGGGAVYVASNQNMYRLVVDANGKIHSDDASGAWKAAYDRGIRISALKVADGTGSTPTLMGFGPDEDKLVVITDGAQKMRLVAFWRDQLPAGWQQKPGTLSARIADQRQVDVGDDVETVQSEQSVSTYGDYAFVVNNIISKDAPYLARDNYYVSMLNGATRPGPKGVAMLKWDQGSNGWKQLWMRNDVSSISTVPMISGGGRMAIIDGYFTRDWNDRYHIGMDLDSGDTVLKIHTGSDPRFNGMYSAIKVNETGAIQYGMAFGLVRLDTTKMKKLD
ncbi:MULTISPECIES: hypothetical protein [Pseudomonas]|uniref:hypothetical protein n=1 Tax=Pseudomonas TaxID=286 RepID=UPI00285E9A9E|nr:MULTISPECIES: hypothetical protein [Pseudomonas]MDR6927802.1 hypothetical protein [Pseudomonas sp. BE134]MDR7283513.1 hypothetical protein [Pseudomonas corrugata]